jgi:hypothetical protein
MLDWLTTRIELPSALWMLMSVFDASFARCGGRSSASHHPTPKPGIHQAVRILVHSLDAARAHSLNYGWRAYRNPYELLSIIEKTLTGNDNIYGLRFIPLTRCLRVERRRGKPELD